MGLPRNFDWVKDGSFVTAFFTIIFLVSPGIAVIAVYFPEHIIGFDWLKLILLSLAFTAPLSILSSVILAPSDEKMREADDYMFNNFVIGSFATAICVYASLIFTYFNDLSFQTYIFAAVVTTVFITLNDKYSSRTRDKKSSKNSTSS